MATAEHVFEAQLIGDFFTMWLDQGHIRNQEPSARNPQPKIPCDWTHEYILTASPDFGWTLPEGGPTVAFIYLLLGELGNISHLKRLTILKARPNRMKGTMFTGNQPISLTTFGNMSPDEQLASVKEMGKKPVHLLEYTLPTHD